MSILKQVQIHGHRGARGLFPENTITAFIEAVKLGVRTLEMDVVVSKDLKVVVSHEEWMNEAFCLQPNGNVIELNSKEKYNLYKMNYGEIASYDCGSKVNPEFPFQKNSPEHKPLLSDVINTVESYTKNNNLPEVTYNIEIKSELFGDHIFHPEPSVFVQLVLNELELHPINNRFILQSFDVRILQEIKKIKSDIVIGLLVENYDSLQTNLKRLGFIPNMYNPEFPLVTPELIKELHHKNIQIIPWTVNEITDMKNLITMGVDGIITDYPNRAIELIKSV
jgi:glycerophosphoryl diester phosphodiesterase